MLIAVVLKQVPDTEADIMIHPDNSARIAEDDLKWIMNPYDEYAVEAAVSLAEEHGADTLAVCIGPARSESVIRTAMAMDIDSGLLITHDSGYQPDIISQARIVAAALRDSSPDLIFCGREQIDTGDDAMAAALAEYLNMPHALNVSKLDLTGNTLNIEREVDGGLFRVTLSLPGVVSCQKGLNEPRYPNLMAVRRAQKKPLQAITIQDLGLDGSSPLLQCLTLTAPPPRAAGTCITGDPDDTARRAADWLTDNTQVI
jgi:electron transfer flavoprotein beta subunit